MSLPFVLTSARFPDGTSVSAYAQSDWDGPPPSDGDVAYATAVETQTVASGSATFSALTDNTDYYAGGTVSTVPRYVRFRTASSSATLSGTAATRPGATTVAAGTTHFATDTGVLSQSDHSTWTTISQGPARKVNTVADATATYTVPAVTAGTVHQITLTVSSTFTFPAAGAGKEFYIALKQGPTGSFTVTWPGTVLWPANTAPTLTTTTGKTDLLHFICANGTNWLGRAVAQNF